MEQKTYSCQDVKRVFILNEKAKYKGMRTLFRAVLSSGSLASEILSNPYLYAGIKVVLKDGSILTIYVSKEKTMVNIDVYMQNQKKQN